MNIKHLHTLARSLNYSDFKAEIAKQIDNIPPTVKCDNEYIVVNKNSINN